MFLNYLSLPVKTQPGVKEIIWLGETLLKTHPEVATRLLNQMKPPVKKKEHTVEEINHFILRVEICFALPKGAIAGRDHTGSISRKKTYGSLCEIRKAAIYHLAENSQCSYMNMADCFGMASHAGIIKSIRKAKGHIETGDETFFKYYCIIKAIEV